MLTGVESDLLSEHSQHRCFLRAWSGVFGQDAELGHQLQLHTPVLSPGASALLPALVTSERLGPGLSFSGSSLMRGAVVTPFLEVRDVTALGGTAREAQRCVQRLHKGSRRLLLLVPPPFRTRWQRPGRPAGADLRVLCLIF